MSSSYVSHVLGLVVSIYVDVGFLPTQTQTTQIDAQTGPLIEELDKAKAKMKQSELARRKEADARDAQSKAEASEMINAYEQQLNEHKGQRAVSVPILEFTRTCR